MKNSILSRLFLYTLMLTFLAAPAWAGGLYIQEFATPSLGSANAGAQAWADNASTAFFNPAGMTRHPSLAYRVNDWLSIGGGVGFISGGCQRPYRRHAD